MINYVASALGCVIFAMVFGIYAKGDIMNMSNTVLSDGFVPTMWFSIIILMLALLCTLSVKDKIVKSK